MNHKPLDDILKQKLEGIEVDFNPSHWSMMEQELNQDANVPEELGDKNLDTTVAAALVGMEVPYNEEHWSLMAQELDTPVPQELGDNNLDTVVAAALVGMEVPYNAEHWNLMTQELDAHGEVNEDLSVEEQIDQTAYDALSNSEVPYNRASWPIMEHKLMQYEDRRKQVIRNKVIEASLLALAFFTFFHFFANGDRSKPDQLTTPVNSIEQPLANLESKSAETVLGTSADAVVSKTAADLSNSTNTADESRLPSKAMGRDPLLPVNKTAYSSENIALNGPGSIDHGLADKENISQVTTVLPQGMTPGGVAISGAERALFLGFDGLDISETLISSELPNEMNVFSIQPKRKKSSTYFSIVAGPDVNFIITPASETFETDEFSQTEMGYHFGFLIGKKWRKFGLESGALYTYKKYTPETKITLVAGNTAVGFIGDGVVNAEMDIVQVPLNLTYDLIQKPKWNLGVKAGITANVLATKYYDYDRFCLGCEPDGLGSGGFGNAVPDLPRTKGLLDGGSLSENAYLGYQVGMYFERNLWSGSTLFFAPQLQSHLTKGIGPDSDKIHSLSIQTGVKIGF